MAEAAQEAQENPTETEARNLGWVNKDEFKGDPEKWRPAEEFLDRGKRILPIVLKDNERLQRNLNRVKDELKELRDSTKQLVEFHTKAEERAYNKAKAELESKVRTAAANADTAAVDAGMRELDQLAKDHTPKTEKKVEQQQVVDPIIQDWIDTNDWFTKDRTLNAFAVDVYGELERSKPGVSKAELLAETKKRTQDKFPEKFGISDRGNSRETPAAVASPTGAAEKKRGKTYSDLPADAKAACDRFVKNIPGYTREKYVKDYDWGE